MSWIAQLSITFDPARPRYRQLTDALIGAITTGRLQPGDRLPGSRQLALQLGVSRNTATAAYQDLEAEGWVTRTVGAGTRVNHKLPPAPPGPTPREGRSPPRRPPAAGFRVLARGDQSPHAGLPPGATTLRWDFGVPDVRLAPTDALARALRRALRTKAELVLQYQRGSDMVTPPLPRALSRMLGTRRGMAAEPADILVTEGSQMALYLAGQALLAPGDTVVVEHPGYPGAWQVWESLGARIVSVPVDEGGLVVDDLADRLARGLRPRAVFVTPHHQFPTTVVLQADRRLRLLQLAQEHRFAIIEDDYDHEFHFDARPIPPLAALDDGGVVVYVGSLSKIVAPGLRAGYLVGPRDFIAAAAARSEVIRLQGNALMDRALAELFEDGEIQRHWRRGVKIYRRRRDHLAGLLRRRLGDALSFRVPEGGLALWARVHPSVDLTRWADRARDRGLVFRTGDVFYRAGTPPPCVRLGFARLGEDELSRAVDLLQAALP